MVFYIVLGLISGSTAYLMIRDMNQNRRLKKIENTLKTYIKNGKKGQAQKTKETGDTDGHKSSNASTETPRR